MPVSEPPDLFKAWERALSINFMLRTKLTRLRLEMEQEARRPIGLSLRTQRRVNTLSLWVDQFSYDLMGTLLKHQKHRSTLADRIVQCNMRWGDRLKEILAL